MDVRHTPIKELKKSLIEQNQFDQYQDEINRKVSKRVNIDQGNIFSDM